MKFILGCLAGVVLLVVLVVGGCVGLIAYGVSQLPPIPPYASKVELEKKYGKDLSAIQGAITAGEVSSLKNLLSEDIQAVYLDSDDLLGRYSASNKSYYTSMGTGVGTLLINGQTVACLVYQIEIQEDKYAVFIKDTQAAAGEPKVEK